MAAGIPLVAFVGWFLLTPVDAAPEAGGVELRAVKYADLAQAIRDQRGKVVVIDVWANFCVPCKREFPHLVELHHKYGSRGLVCMSLTVDPAESRDDALKFLVKQKATFANYWLDEKAEVWQERWRIIGPPAVFVFDRQGKRAAKFYSEDDNKPFTYAEVEKLVQQLLALSP
jgi:thiol-disulfide isomerase/thioredoxin